MNKKLRAYLINELNNNEFYKRAHLKCEEIYNNSFIRKDENDEYIRAVSNEKNLFELIKKLNDQEIKIMIILRKFSYSTHLKIFKKMKQLINLYEKKEALNLQIENFE